MDFTFEFRSLKLYGFVWNLFCVVDFRFCFVSAFVLPFFTVDTLTSRYSATLSFSCSVKSTNWPFPKSFTIIIVSIVVIEFFMSYFNKELPSNHHHHRQQQYFACYFCYLPLKSFFFLIFHLPCVF